MHKEPQKHAGKYQGGKAAGKAGKSPWLHSTLVPAVGPAQTPRLELHLLESPKALKKKDKVTELKDNPMDTGEGGTGAGEEVWG